MPATKGYIFNTKHGNEDDEKKKTANILIDGEISSWWGIGLKDMAKDIANADADEIMVQINSGGGSVFEGMAIAAFIKGNPVNINTSILGLAASIATPIALAGKETSIAKGSMFMIHNASSLAFGDADDLRGTADLLETIDGQLTSIYVDAIAKNGKLINDSREETKAKVIEWQNKETWFSAEKAVEHGFIGKLTEGVEFVNKANAQDIINACSKYKNVPATFLNKVKKIANMADKTEEQEKEEGLFNKFKAWLSSDAGKTPKTEAPTTQVELTKEEKKQAAIAAAKEYGFYRDPVAEVKDDTTELEAKLEASKKRIQEVEAAVLKLEEEKNGSPLSAPNNIDGGNKSKELTEQQLFDKMLSPFKQTLDEMAKSIYK